LPKATVGLCVNPPEQRQARPITTSDATHPPTPIEPHIGLAWRLEGTFISCSTSSAPASIARKACA